MNRDFRIVFVCVVIGTTLAATALAGNAGSLHKVEPLWVDGAPGTKGSEDGDRPTLTIYLPPKEKATGTGVVICPGGGYGFLAMDHEGHQIAQWLNSLGVAGFILKYRHLLWTVTIWVTMLLVHGEVETQIFNRILALLAKMCNNV